MPRATRRNLAKEEATPTRSSPRASTKASTAAAGSPAKTRGRRSERVEEDVNLAAEAEEPVEKRGRGRQSAGGTPAGRQSRSRGRGGGDEPDVEEKTTPSSGSKRGGRGRPKKESTPQEEEAVEPEEDEQVEEVSPKPGRGRPRGRGRGRGKSPAATSSSRGSRSSRRSGAAEEEGEAETPEKEVKTTPTRGRGRGRGASSRLRGRPGRGGGEADEEKAGEMDASVTADAEEKAESEASAAAAAASDKVDTAKEPPQTVTEEKKTEPPAETSADPVSQAGAVPKAAVEPMEVGASAKDSASGVNNGDVSDQQEAKKLTGVKRKLEEEEAEVKGEEDKTGPKRARVNGEGLENAPVMTPAKTAEVTDSSKSKQESTSVSSGDAEIPDDYVVVNKEDVPAADSAEVAAAVPQPAKATPPVAAAVPAAEPMDTDTSGVVPGIVAGGSSASITVVPLTEAELAKAYANDVQGKERDDRDEVSSTVVEVGSVAGSDVTGTGRGLDTSELQSGSNSLDGDFAGDTSITEGQLMPEEPAPAPPVCQQQAFSVPDPVPVRPPTVEVNANTNNVDIVVQAQTEATQASTAAVPPTTSITSATPAVGHSAAVQNSVCPPSSKSSSSVSDRLGAPDPTFLATYSSPNIFTRAFVPNPAVPADSIDDSRKFTVVSYNILAECARQRADYSYTAPEFLGQEYRHGLLMKELTYLNGDVVCLQEVNPAYFNTVLLPDMRKMGYDGTMMKRTKDYWDEGEATFYKTEMFELESSKGVSLTDLARKEMEAGGLSPEVGAAVMKYLDRADVVLVTKLRSKATGKSFTVGNIHVVWDQMLSPDVQCIQAACAIKEVVGTAGGEGSPHIICGDFNSEWSSPAYQLVLDGYLSDTSIRKLQAVERLDLSEGSKSLVNHLWRAFQHTSSNLRSAYSTVTGSEPEITSFTKFMHTSVDYIFFSSGSLLPVGVLKTIDKAVVDATGGLPNRDFPSDHLAMKAVMAFTN